MAERANPAIGLTPDVNPYGGTGMRLQRLQVSDGLCLRQRPEGKGVLGNGKIRLHVLHQFHKEAMVRSAFMELPGRVEVTRPVSRRRR